MPNKNERFGALVCEFAIGQSSQSVRNIGSPCKNGHRHLEFGMISLTAKYALRAVVYLASCEGAFVNAAEVAEATLVPHDYLLKVLKELDDSGIVQSRRGPGGATL